MVEIDRVDCYGGEWWLGLILRYVDKQNCLKSWRKPPPLLVWVKKK